MSLGSGLLMSSQRKLSRRPRPATTGDSVMILGSNLFPPVNVPNLVNLNPGPSHHQHIPTPFPIPLKIRRGS